MIKKFFCFLLLFSLIFTNIHLVSSEPVKDRWTKISTGITGGIIRSIAQSKQNENLMYCATFGKGIYKSINNGFFWDPVNQGLDNLYILSLAVHPKNDQIVLAGTWGFGVYKTTDGGKNWEKSHIGIDHNTINYLLFDPNDSNYLYALTKDGLFKSWDVGKTWIYMPTDFMRSPAEYFYSPINKPKKFYVGVKDKGLFYSSDKGETWDELPFHNHLGNIFAVAEDPVLENVVYVGTEQNGIMKYKYDEFKKMWEFEKFGFANFKVTSIIFNPQNNDELVVSTFGNGVYKSKDHGRTWDTILTGPGATDIRFLYQDMHHVPVIWAGTHSMGIWKSNDRGTTWDDYNTNLDGLIMNGVVTDPKDPTILYAFAYGSVFRSQSRGLEWERLGKGLPNFEIKSLTVDPNKPEILYATTDGVGAYKSIDRGDTWKAINNGLKYNRVFSLAIDPTNTKHLLAGSYGKGIYQSYDSGDSWILTNQDIQDAYVVSILFHPTEKDTIFIGSYSSGVFKSTDGGIHWSPIKAGLESNFVLTLSMNTNDPNILYCGIDGYKAYKTVNGGLNWAIMDLGLPQKVSRYFVNDTKYPNIMYCCGSEGIYYSANRGIYWKAMSEGLDKNTGLNWIDANHLCIAQESSYILYASTYMGIYRFEMTDLPDIDRSGPVIDLDNKQDPMKTMDAYVNITGKVVDEYTGVERFEINKEEILLAPNGKFEKNIAVKTGYNQVDLVAIDKAGNVNQMTLKVFYDDGVDRIPPKLLIDYPTDESKTSQTPILIKGRAIDEESGMQSVKINNLNAQMDKDGFFSFEFELSPGENRISISAWDKVGNETIEKRTVYYVKLDITPPIIEIFSPEEGKPLADSNVTIVGRVTDMESGIQNLFINNQPIKIDKLGNFNYPVIMNKGENTYLLVAINGDGLKSEKNIVLIYQPKEITIELYIGNSLAFINGKRSILDAPPFIFNGRTVVPLRFIGEAFGALIDWNPTLRSITLDFKKKDIQLVLTIDDKTVYINGKKTTLEVPPMIQKGRTFVPLRFIGEATGCSIDWDAKEQKITLGYSE